MKTLCLVVGSGLKRAAFCAGSKGINKNSGVVKGVAIIGNGKFEVIGLHGFYFDFGGHYFCKAIVLPGFKNFWIGFKIVGCIILLILEVVDGGYRDGCFTIGERGQVER